MKKFQGHPYEHLYELPWWVHPKRWWPTWFLARIEWGFEAIQIEDELSGRNRLPRPPKTIRLEAPPF